MGGSSQTASTNQTTNTEPWSVQAPYLKQIFSEAQGAYNKSKGVAPPTDFTAQYTPEQIGAFTNMLRYGTGSNALPASSADTALKLAGAGTGAAQGGLTRLGAFTPQGGTQSNIDAANQYVAGMDIPALVKAGMHDANQEASEETLPQIARNAAGTGNINSSRRAIREGIVQRGLGEQAQNLAAQLGEQGYEKGLNLAEQNSESSNSNTLSQLLGLISGGNSVANSGVNAGSTSIGQQGGLFDIAASGVAGQNAAKQAELTNLLKRYQAGVTAPFLPLDNYFNIVGSKNFGGTSTSNGTQETDNHPGPFSIIGGLLSAGGSLLHSDRRIKKDIQLVGELFDGMPVYRFRYKKDPTNTLYIGLIAQEVEKLMPEAVVEIDGIKHVNYDLATQPSIVEADFA